MNWRHRPTLPSAADPRSTCLWAGRPAPAKPHQFIDGDIQCDDEVIEDGAHKGLSWRSMLSVQRRSLAAGGLVIHLAPATTPTDISHLAEPVDDRRQGGLVADVAGEHDIGDADRLGGGIKWAEDRHQAGEQLAEDLGPPDAEAADGHIV
jgi:hypothetical protein